MDLSLRSVPKDTALMDVGDKITKIPLVLEGAIRIMSENKSGDELLLYYLETGDSCAMTMSCCIGNKTSGIRAITEQDTQVIFVPVQKMSEWVVKYPSWRAFVFESYDTRLNEMLEAIDVLAFNNMEERLYKYLRDKAMVTGSGSLHITHYQIANELNTSRVVISRLVKKLALTGKISNHRNRIDVLELMPSK
jgi:CRP/FNR family transcriptional regulator